MAIDAKALNSRESHFMLDTHTLNDTNLSINGSSSEIENLEYFPEKVLLHIFSTVDDIDLLHLSNCSYRFEGIAKIAFKRKYTDNYFVFDSDSKSKQKVYWELFERFGGYAKIKAIEVRYIDNMNEKHWLPKLLRKHSNQLEKLSFRGCWFKGRGINQILSQHTNVTHLILRVSAWNGELVLPEYRNLKRLELCDNHLTGLITTRTILNVMRKNPSLEVLDLSHCGPTISIYCIAKHLKHLKHLNLISSTTNTWTITDETMDYVADSLKHLESLRLTVNNYEYIELVKRLGLNCKNLKQLELEHNFYDNTNANTGDEIIKAASTFEMVESLELSHLRNYNSIDTLVEHLPKLHRLRDLKLFMDTPLQSDTFIPTLSNKSPSLKTITITSWNDAKFSWPKFFIGTAIFKEMIKTVREPPRCKVELKEFHSYFGFATNKEITWCNERSHWIVNDSIFFSFRMVFLFLIIICAFFYLFGVFITLGIYLG